jgi:hypothetical protein
MTKYVERPEWMKSQEELEGIEVDLDKESEGSSEEEDFGMRTTRRVSKG